MLTPRSFFSFAATLAISLWPAFSASDEPTLEQRLERLEATLESARVDAHVPGMSIAVVQAGELVWARGFGLADVAAERPADAQTIYAIGSSTKAFTATLVGMLVDEGKASWDDPVTAYLPYFDLAVKSDDADAECTLRDLLSHRHGFSRMGILWFGGQVPREKVLRTAAGAEPWDDFRARFHYCNVTYLAAGEAAGVAGGSTWDALMQERLLGPLKMTASTLSTREAQEDPRLALGYSWDGTRERFEHEEMVSLDNIAPAGSVNSNVLDMAQWLRLQLGRGEVDGARLVSTERILETWSPQIEIATGVSYGLGWMLREHDGRRVVEHGGNIAGFSAQVAFMPEEGVGYVLLMNSSASPLREASLAIVFDALHDEWPGEHDVAAAEAVDFADYVGTYIANFGSFRDAEFEVLVNGDHLALDIPGQRASDLHPPDAEGNWISTLSHRVAVSFRRDDGGAVIGLAIHQGEFQFEVPRKGIAVPPAEPVEGLEKYVGTFVRAQGGKRVKLSIEEGRLTMEDKGKLLAFDPPDAEGHAALRARADFGATFETDGEGRVMSFIFHGSSGDRLFTRLGTDLPTLAEVLALRQTDARVAAMEAAGGTRLRGEVWIAQAGVRGALTIYTRGGARSAHHMDFGEFGRVDVVVNGREAWRYDSMRGFEALKGDELAQALLGHPAAIEGDWREYFDKIEVVRKDTVNERAVHVLRLQERGLPARTYWVDAEHGDVLRAEHVALEATQRIPVTITQSEFEVRDGIRRPLRIEIENPESGRMVMTFEEVETGVALGDKVFTLEDPGPQAKR